MDRSAFDQRVMAQAGRLYRIAITFLTHRQDCEDAIQEALVKAWMNLHTLRSDAYFDTWLCRIVINECKNALKRRVRGKTETLLPDEPAIEQPAPVLWAGISKMGIAYRLPFMLHYVEGYEQKEIAVMLGLPISTVKWRIHKGKRLLADFMDKEELQ